LYFEWIKALYPSAKSILVVRDPVANVASIHKRYADFNLAMRSYQMYAERLVSISAQTDVLVVRHEEVTSSTAETLQRVLAFLGSNLRLDERCIVNAYTKREYTGTTVDRNRAGITPDTLSASQIRTVEKHFWHVRERFYGSESVTSP
jgi:hypothetical protein